MDLRNHPSTTNPRMIWCRCHPILFSPCLSPWQWCKMYLRRGNLERFWIDDLMSVLWRPSVPDLCIASTLRTRQKRRSRLRKPRAITALVDLLPVTNVQVARMMLDKYIHSSFWTHEMKVPAPWLQVFHVQRNAWVVFCNKFAGALWDIGYPLISLSEQSKWSVSFLSKVFIGEYHSVHGDMMNDLTRAIKMLWCSQAFGRVRASSRQGPWVYRTSVRLAKSARYPFFMGYSFFEFSRSYWKGGPEMEFGMYGSLASFDSDSISCCTTPSTVMNQAEFNEVLCIMQMAIWNLRSSCALLAAFMISEFREGLKSYRLWWLSFDGHELHWTYVHHLEFDTRPNWELYTN